MKKIKMARGVTLTFEEGCKQVFPLDAFLYDFLSKSEDFSVNFRHLINAKRVDRFFELELPSFIHILTQHPQRALGAFGLPF